MDKLICGLSNLLMLEKKETRALITLKNNLLYGEKVYNFKELESYTK